MFLPVLFITQLLIATTLAQLRKTPLDDYVWAPDANYKWTDMVSIAQ